MGLVKALLPSLADSSKAVREAAHEAIVCFRQLALPTLEKGAPRLKARISQVLRDIRKRTAADAADEE